MNLLVNIVAVSDRCSFIGVANGRYYGMLLDEEGEIKLGDDLSGEDLEENEGTVDFRNARTGDDVYIEIEELPSLEHAIMWIFGMARGKPFKLDVGTLNLPDSLPRPLGEDPSQN